MVTPILRHQKNMPPKAASTDAPKPKKKSGIPPVVCGCETIIEPPPVSKGKKKPVEPTVHAPNCTFQRGPCHLYPHLPKCSACEDGCSYCMGINPYCLYCWENRCKFQFKRDVCGWSKPVHPAVVFAKLAAAAAAAAPAAAKSTKK